MREITSLDELKELADKYDDLYIRYSSDIEGDKVRQRSTNHVTGNQESGLSANGISGRDRLWIAINAVEYHRLCSGPGWIIRGRDIGRGSDNEPLLHDIEVIGVLGDSCMEKCHQLSDLHFLHRWMTSHANYQESQELPGSTEWYTMTEAEREPWIEQYGPKWVD